MFSGSSAEDVLLIDKLVTAVRQQSDDHAELNNVFQELQADYDRANVDVEDSSDR